MWSRQVLSRLIRFIRHLCFCLFRHDVRSELLEQNQEHWSPEGPVVFEMKLFIRRVLSECFTVRWVTIRRNELVKMSGCRRENLYADEMVCEIKDLEWTLRESWERKHNKHTRPRPRPRPYRCQCFTFIKALWII